MFRKRPANPNGTAPARRPGRLGERGASITEFAFAATVFFMLTFGIIDMARAMQSWITLQHAAREGARYAVTGQVKCTGYTDNRNQCIIQRAKSATQGMNGGGTGGADVTVSYKKWDYPSYSTVTNNNAGDQCDAIEVKVSYTHEFAFIILKAFAPSGVSMSGTQRMVNEPFGPCS